MNTTKLLLPASLANLRLIAPDIVFSVAFSPDQDASWDGDTPEPAGQVGYVIDYTASAIVQGGYIEGHSTLSNAWYPAGEVDPDTGGYTAQKLAEAAEYLAGQLGASSLRGQATDAIDHLYQLSR